MDKNSIIGIVLIAAILVVMGIINKPSKEEQEARRHTLDSLRQVELLERQKSIEQQAQPEEQKKDQEAEEVTSDTVVTKDIIDEYGRFAESAAGKEEFYTIENDVMVLVLSSKGGRPYSVELKDYQTHDSLPLILFSGDSTVFNLEFYSQSRQINTDNLYFIPNRKDSIIKVENREESISLRLNAGEGKYLEYSYTVYPGRYHVDMEMRFVGMHDLDQSNKRFDMRWEIYSISQEKGWKNEAMYSSIFYKPLDEKVDKLNMRSNKPVLGLPDEIPQVEWIAFKDQFFSSVLMPEKPIEDVSLTSVRMPENSKYIKQYKSLFTLPYNHTPDETINVGLYFGPNKYKLLRKNYGEKEVYNIVVIGGGIIRWINRFLIIKIFDFLSKYLSNYGLIILLMTIIIKLILLPLTFRSYMSQAKMRALKPLTDEINKKYPKEKAMERQQATMALYKKAGVSPLGGCLPMALQMPILYAMFRFFPASIELRQQSFLWAHDLSTYDSIINLPWDIPMYGNHVSLFTLLMTITTIVTMKMNSGTTDSNQMPGMKTMMYIMPISFMFFLNNFSAALTYYYFLANVITFGQNLLFKQFVDEDELFKKMQNRKAKPAKKSGFQKRLEEMAKQRSMPPPKKKKK